MNNSSKLYSTQVSEFPGMFYQGFRELSVEHQKFQVDHRRSIWITLRITALHRELMQQNNEPDTRHAQESSAGIPRRNVREAFLRFKRRPEANPGNPVTFS